MGYKNLHDHTLTLRLRARAYMYMQGAGIRYGIKMSAVVIVTSLWLDELHSSIPTCLTDC